MKAKLKVLTATIAAIILLTATPLVLADQLVKVTIVSGEVFQNTGYSFKSWTVDVSKIKDAKQISIKITGSASGDPYYRFLCVKIDGQIINQRSDGGEWPGATAVVHESFDITYDVTNLVKGKSSVKVEIGITTFVGSWTISAEFNAVLDDYFIIPTPDGDGGGWTIPTAWLAAGAGILCVAGAWYLRSKELE